jgi:hypothetical protein
MRNLLRRSSPHGIHPRFLFRYSNTGPHPLLRTHLLSFLWSSLFASLPCRMRQIKDYNLCKAVVGWDGGNNMGVLQSAGTHVPPNALDSDSRFAMHRS